tara:strand:+ start:3334 stop:4296 length:963 start_codon:yes stop_codon:yes gene_type:complete
MQRSGVLSDASIISKCVYAELPIPVSQYTNVMGVEKSSVFVTRKPKDYRAPLQIIPAYVAKNKAQKSGMNKLLSQKLIEQEMKTSMNKPGSYDVLKGAPLLVGSSTQNFHVKNIQKMIQVVNRPYPTPRAPEMFYQMPGRNTFVQENASSRMIALSNARTRVPGLNAAGTSIVSGITTEIDDDTTISLASRRSAPASTYSGISDMSSSVSGLSVSDMGSSVSGLSVPDMSTTSSQPNLSLTSSFGPLQQQMLATTIRETNQPILRQSRISSMFSVKKQSAEAGPSSLERVPVQARGQAGPQLIQPAKAPPPPDSTQEKKY